MEQRGRGGNSKPAEFWIKHLHLVEHPGEEDGFFAVPFEDKHCVLSRNKVVTGQLISNQCKNVKCNIQCNPSQDERPAASIAYFLQKVGVPMCGRTMFFRCQSTEMLFHHAGLPLAVLILGPEAGTAQDLRRVVLGPRVDQGHVLAFPVPADTWFTRLVKHRTRGKKFRLHKMWMIMGGQNQLCSATRWRQRRVPRRTTRCTAAAWRPASTLTTSRRPPWRRSWRGDGGSRGTYIAYIKL